MLLQLRQLPLLEVFFWLSFKAFFRYWKAAQRSPQEPSPGFQPVLIGGVIDLVIDSPGIDLVTSSGLFPISSCLSCIGAPTPGHAVV